MKWRDYGAKLLVHIGDAPCHGNMYHSGMPDDYPSGGTEDRPWKELFQEMIQKGINYQFYKLNSSTDKMFNLFKEYFGGVKGDGTVFIEEGTMDTSIADSFKKSFTSVLTKTLSTSSKIASSRIAPKLVTRGIDMSLFPIDEGDEGKGETSSYLNLKKTVTVMQISFDEKILDQKSSC